MSHLFSHSQWQLGRSHNNGDDDEELLHRWIEVVEATAHGPGVVKALHACSRFILQSQRLADLADFQRSRDEKRNIEDRHPNLASPEGYSSGQSSTPVFPHSPPEWYS